MSFRFKMMGIEVVCDTADEAFALATKVEAANRQGAVAARFDVSQHTSKSPPDAGGAHKAKTLFPSVLPPSSDAALAATKAILGGKPKRKGFDKAEATSIFLKALDDAWPEGVSGDVLCSALGLSHPKALGGRLALINEYIKEAGFEADNVYFMKRDSKNEGKRTWYAGTDSGNLRKQMM